MSSAPNWLQFSCPICKQALTITVDILLLTRQPEKQRVLYRDYADQVMLTINTNEVAATHFFSKYLEVDDYQLKNDLIFLDVNLSVAYNLFSEMLSNTLDFFKKGDNEILANVIAVLQL